MASFLEPIRVGNVTLGHRVAMAPLTRRRADPHGVPSDLAVEYYAQRAQFPGTLIVAEASAISSQVGPPFAVPGLFAEAQLSKWKEITSTVHAKGSFIFSQLWALGKAPPSPSPNVQSTPVAKDEGQYFRTRSVDELNAEEIQTLINWYADAAYNSVNKAGFDGAEIHAANGYLVEQFIRESNNHRTDKYGGSIENRTRFARDVLDAAVEKLGGDAKLVGIRISPWSQAGPTYPTSQTVAEYAYLLGYIQETYPDLAYVSVVEPRLAHGHADDAAIPHIPGLNLEEWNLFLRIIWKGVIVRAGGLVNEISSLTEKDPKVIVAVGRYFISNPDLVYRVRHGLALTKYDRPTFYTPGPKGYIDYPNAPENPHQL